MKGETEGLPLWKTLLIFLLFLFFVGTIYYFFGSTGMLVSILVLMGVSHVFNR
jgi:hypothetical protein